MTSAFGVEHDDISKAVGPEYQELVRARAARKTARRLTAKPKKPYTQPTADQRADQQVRRGQQQADSKAAREQREHRRKPGTPDPWHKFVKPGPTGSVAISSGLAGGAAYALHRDHGNARQAQLAKADDHAGRNAALGAVAGAGATDAAMTVGGQAAKAHLARQRQRQGVSQHDERVWREHKAKFGVNGRSTKETPNSTKVKMHATYPKELPGWRLQRVLAHKNRPEVAGAVVAAGALTGAGIAHHRSKQLSKGVSRAFTDPENVVRNVARVGSGTLVATAVHQTSKHAKAASKVAKADKREAGEEAAAATVGGAAGQGAYQATGYETKHHVDRKTRSKSVPAPERRLRDKVLKEPKKKYGMHLPNGSPGRDNVGFHRNYPKALPYSRQIRLLGHTHEGKLGMAVGATATAAGAAGAAGLAHHHLKKGLAVTTSAFGVGHAVSKADGQPKKKKNTATGETVAGTAAIGGSLASSVGAVASEGKARRHAMDAGYHSHEERKRSATLREIDRQELNAHRVGAARAGDDKERARAFSRAVKDRGDQLRAPHAAAQLHHAGEAGTAARKLREANAMTRGLNATTYGAGAVGGGLVLHAAYRRARSASQAKQQPVAKSAFGVEHEIEKGLIGEALKGAKAGLGGRSFGQAPGSLAGMLGAKSGNVTRNAGKAVGGGAKAVGGGVKAGASKVTAVPVGAKNAARDYGQGLKHGAKGGSFGQLKTSSTAGQLGATSGNSVRNGGLKARKLATDTGGKVKAAGSAAGAKIKAAGVKLRPVRKAPAVSTPAVTPKPGGDRLTLPLTVGASGAAGAAIASAVTRKDVSKSAFGVDHEIEKGMWGEALKIGQDAVKGLRGGVAGNSFGTAPGTTAGMLGAKTGNVARTGGLKARKLASTPKGAAAAGAGAGLGTGLLLRNNQ